MICVSFPIDSSLNNYGSLVSWAWKIISRNFIQLGLYLFTGATPLFTHIATYMPVVHSRYRIVIDMKGTCMRIAECWWKKVACQIQLDPPCCADIVTLITPDDLAPPHPLQKLLKVQILLLQFIPWRLRLLGPRRSLPPLSQALFWGHYSQTPYSLLPYNRHGVIHASFPISFCPIFD